MRCGCLHTPQSSYSQKMLNYECNTDSLMIHTWLFRHVNFLIHQTLQHFTYTFVYSMPVVKTCLPSDKFKSFEGPLERRKRKGETKGEPYLLLHIVAKTESLTKVESFLICQ